MKECSTHPPAASLIGPTAAVVVGNINGEDIVVRVGAEVVRIPASVADASIAGGKVEHRSGQRGGAAIDVGVAAIAIGEPA